jgi:hypothetical protein
MQFVPLAGGVLDLPVLLTLKQKVGQYAVLIDDVAEAGRRVVYAIAGTFRKARKIWAELTGDKHATVYADTGIIELASNWQGVTWKKNPAFNGQ